MQVLRLQSWLCSWTADRITAISIRKLTPLDPLQREALSNRIDPDAIHVEHLQRQLRYLEHCWKRSQRY